MIEAQQPYEGNLLYAVLHESIYCQGGRSNWAADRVMAADPVVRYNYSEAWEEDESMPTILTGEMVHDIFYPRFRFLTCSHDAIGRKILFHLRQQGA